MKVVCDTNVLVSAILFGGKARDIVRMVSEARIEGFLSLAICEELEEVLLRPKFGLSPEQVAVALELVRQTFHLVCPAERLDVVAEDPADNAVVEAAVAAGADVIVSGDRHLLTLGSFRTIRILSPAAFLATL